ncbi:DUF2384 domain-containing protein [Sphingomonas koreensis]|nr:DUF2384 domain-containing protein [Sphingomonas koreensis]
MARAGRSLGARPRGDRAAPARGRGGVGQSSRRHRAAHAPADRRRARDRPPRSAPLGVVARPATGHVFPVADRGDGRPRPPAAHPPLNRVGGVLVSRGAGGGDRPLREVLALWDGVVLHWDLRGDELSLLLDTGVDGPVDEAGAYRLPRAERRMRLLVELAPILASVLCTEERVRTWLRSANANLGGRTPIETMAQSPEWIQWLVTSLGVAS